MQLDHEDLPWEEEAGVVGVRGCTESGLTSREGPVRSARLRDNKQHCQGVITHAWLLQALIGVARRREGGENKGNGERPVGELAKNRAFDHRVKNYQLSAYCCWTPAPKHHGKCSRSKNQPLSLCTSLIHLLAHTHTQTHRQKSTHIDRHTHTQTNRSVLLPCLGRPLIRVSTVELWDCDTRQHMGVASLHTNTNTRTHSCTRISVSQHWHSETAKEGGRQTLLNNSKWESGA